MREIEIKAKLQNRDRVVAKLSQNNLQLSDPIMQRDQVFSVPGVAGDSDEPAPWLRIRTETKNGVTRHIFTLKKSVHGRNDSIEHETEITNSDEMRSAILQMNFAPYCDVTKTRQKVRDGDYEICLDSVEGLDLFIEIEKMADDDANHDDVTAELWKYFSQLGISPDDEVHDGYDVLMRKARGEKA